MATTVSLHGNQDTKTQVPGAVITVWDSRITVTFGRGSDEATFFIDCDEDEKVEETLGRALLALTQPQVHVVSEQIK